MAKNELRMVILAGIICTGAVPAQDVAALVEEGKNKASAKQFEAALVPLNRALRQNPENAEALRWRGHCLTALGSYERALADLDAALRIDGTSAWAYYARGMARHHLERHQEAIGDYSEALSRDPANHKAIEWRGFTRAQIGDHLGAYLDFTGALKLDPQNPWVFQARARAAVNLGALDRARDDLSTALRIDAKSADTHAQLGFLQVALGDDRAALVSFDKAFALEPTRHEYARLWRYWLQLRLRRGEAGVSDQLPRSKWPGDLAKALLGELTRAQLLLRLSAYDVPTAELPARRCEAAFYLGVRAMLEGKMHRAREEFRDALVIGDVTMPEWRAARRLARR